jgi:Na+-driven multidrug efflux pump
MPVVALAFSVAPVAGQNFGAGRPSRVRDTFTSAAVMAGSFMLLMTILCQIAGDAMVGVFSDDPQVIWYLSVAAGTLQLVMNLLLLRREFRRRLSFAPAPAVAPAPSGA